MISNIHRLRAVSRFSYESVESVRAAKLRASREERRCQPVTLRLAPSFLAALPPAARSARSPLMRQTKNYSQSITYKIRVRQGVSAFYLTVLHCASLLRTTFCVISALAALSHPEHNRFLIRPSSPEKRMAIYS